MAAKNCWHTYETESRHCHPVHLRIDVFDFVHVFTCFPATLFTSVRRQSAEFDYHLSYSRCADDQKPVRRRPVRSITQSTESNAPAGGDDDAVACPAARKSARTEAAHH